jgi:hypothetical protein
MTTPGIPPQSVGRPPRLSSWYVLRLVSVVLSLLAAAAAIGGSFLTLFEGELLSRGSTQVRLVVTGWTFRAEAGTGVNGSPTTAGSVAHNGYPLAVAGAILMIAALIAFVASQRSAPPAVKSVAMIATAVGAAFLAGTVWTVGLQGAAFAESFRPIGSAPGGGLLTTASGFGAGFWLEVAGATLAVVAAVLVASPWRGPREPTELTTPPYGFPMPPPAEPAAPPSE